MTDPTRNKLAAKILKAEMLGDHQEVARLNEELNKLPDNPVPGTSNGPSTSRNRPSNGSGSSQIANETRHGPRFSQQDRRRRDYRVAPANMSLSDMFVSEQNTSVSDEARMYSKLAAKFSKDDMETKYFRQELDDSQEVLNRSKKPKTESPNDHTRHQPRPDEHCDICFQKQKYEIMIVQDPLVESVYFMVTPGKLQLSTIQSHVIIRNKSHSVESFVASNQLQQKEVGIMVDNFADKCKMLDHGLIIMETHLRRRRNNSDDKNLISRNNHFQVHCVQVIKGMNDIIMHFKNELESRCHDRSLIRVQNRRVQSYLPKGLPYFWVCFGSLTNGFAHVIEDDSNDWSTFGMDVLFGAMRKTFSLQVFNTVECTSELFMKSYKFKVLYSCGRSDRNHFSLYTCPTEEKRSDGVCSRCPQAIPRHLIIEDPNVECVYMTQLSCKPRISKDISNVVIRNIGHETNPSFLCSNHTQKFEVGLFVEKLRKAYILNGYHCVIMETYLSNSSYDKDRNFSQLNLLSGDGHFQIYCYPVREELIVAARLKFKEVLESLQDTDWIEKDGGDIQDYLPAESSYFWVCFDSLDNGFAIKIKQFNEQHEWNTFGLGVLGKLVDENFDPYKLETQPFEDQYERATHFKSLYLSQ